LAFKYQEQFPREKGRYLIVEFANFTQNSLYKPSSMNYFFSYISTLDKLELNFVHVLVMPNKPFKCDE